MAPSKAVRPEKEYVVVKNFEEMQKVGQENANAAMKSFGVVSKGMQAIATEVADYSKKFFEEGTQAFEQLLGTKSVEKAMELQQVYFKNAHEGLSPGRPRSARCMPTSSRRPTSHSKVM
jgi:hypothetical protein